MTYAEVKKAFRQGAEEAIRYWKKHDKPALRQEWNDFTDMLCKNGHITQKQYDTWLNPFIKD